MLLIYIKLKNKITNIFMKTMKLDYSFIQVSTSEVRASLLNESCRSNTQAAMPINKYPMYTFTQCCAMLHTQKKIHYSCSFSAYY